MHNYTHTYIHGQLTHLVYARNTVYFHPFIYPSIYLNSINSYIINSIKASVLLCVIPPTPQKLTNVSTPNLHTWLMLHPGVHRKMCVTLRWISRSQGWGYDNRPLDTIDTAGFGTPAMWTQCVLARWCRFRSVPQYKFYFFHFSQFFIIYISMWLLLLRETIFWKKKSHILKIVEVRCIFDFKSHAKIKL